MSDQTVSQPYMTCEAEDGTGVVFRWHGGEYIDVGTVQDVGTAGIDGDDFHAHDVINVWNHATGAPRIARTLDAFAERCAEWIAEREREG